VVIVCGKLSVVWSSLAAPATTAAAATAKLFVILLFSPTTVVPGVARHGVEVLSRVSCLMPRHPPSEYEVQLEVLDIVIVFFLIFAYPTTHPGQEIMGWNGKPHWDGRFATSNVSRYVSDAADLRDHSAC